MPSKNDTRPRDKRGDLIKVAVILGAHGIRGEVKLLPLIEDVKLLSTQALLDKNGRELFSIKITGTAKDALIAKPSSISDRNDAELLKGKELFAHASALPALADDEFYVEDIIGLKAVLENGKTYGVVEALHNFGAGDIFEIKTKTGNEMLPFKAPWLGEINMEKGTVTVTPPEYSEGEDHE